MSFWIKVTVKASGEVTATTYGSNIVGDPSSAALRTRSGATVSQALRSLASSLVYAVAETVTDKAVQP